MIALSRSASYRLCDGLALRVPVVQASLGICDNPRLAAAVSRAGGLGTLSVRTPDPAAHRRTLARIRKATTRPVLLAFTAEWEREELLDESFAAGFRDFQLFWWNGPRLARRIRARGGRVFWQVGDFDQARDALEAGTDVLVAQGTEAGGQVRSPYPVRELLLQIRGLTGAEKLPVVAGGGLADRHDVRAMLSIGAAAALLGTRFLLTEESAAPMGDKRRLLRASEAHLALDPRLVGDWPCAPRRRLRLGTVQLHRTQPCRTQGRRRAGRCCRLGGFRGIAVCAECDLER